MCKSSKKDQTLNIEHPTSNVEIRNQIRQHRIQNSMFDVGGLMFFLFTFCALAVLSSNSSHAAEPLRALLITGGCCQDYECQKKIHSEGISAIDNLPWTII